ncbi:SPOR domain-containing protein [Amaricoccus macauensis]|uniref:SPOR domain-containing protein n=1 Tax=Amaricoccus macauensis TaxID=57001 RepID=UPI003C7AA528
MNELYSDDYARRDGVDANRILPSGFRGAVSAVVFLGLVGSMGVWAYRLGTRDATEVPIIRAMQGPSRVAPEDPGGFKAAHQGREINKVLEGTPAPAPREAVVIPAAASLTEEDKPQRDLAQASQSKAVAELVEQAALEPTLGAADADEDVALVEPAPDMGGEVELEAPVEEIATDVPSGPRPFSRPSNLVRVSARASAPAPAATAAAGIAPPVRSSASQAAPAPQIQEISSVSSGTRLVQLGAFDSEANTREAWRRLVAANSDLLSSKSLYVERATNNARVFYRLRVAGFQNTDQTRDLCESLRARSIDCIPVTIR